MDQHYYSKPVYAGTFHGGKLLLYALLSGCDLWLTLHLLGNSNGCVYESNPLAHSSLAAFGSLGLVVYKVLAVLLVAGVTAIISRYRPQLGGRLLQFGCLITGGVVVYSTVILGVVREAIVIAWAG
jgi:hypothetical protein